MKQLERLEKMVTFWTKQNAERQRAAAASQVECAKWTYELDKAKAAAEAVASVAIAGLNEPYEGRGEIYYEHPTKADEKVPC